MTAPTHTPSDASDSHDATLWSRLGLVAAPLASLALWLAPLPVPELAHRMAALLIGVVILWVSEALPIQFTAMLIAPLLVAFGIASPTQAFAPYADPLLFLFYASFFLAEAMSRHGLDRRMAHALIFAPVIAGHAGRTRAAIMTMGALMSMWMSNTTATAIALPILMGAYAGMAQGERAVRGGLLGVAYACSVGGMGTPVGTPPNMITVRMLEKAGVHLSFLDWMKIGVPVALVMLLLSHLVTGRLYPASAAGLATSALPDSERADLSAWSRPQRLTLVVFVVMVVAWVLPELLEQLGAPFGATLLKRLPASTAGLAAATLLFLLRERPRGPAILPWSAARNADWGIIMLFGGGISLGTQMFETGLAESIGRGFVAVAGTLDVWSLTALAIVITIMMSEVSSNTATANMLLPIVLGIATEMHVSPIPPALGVGLGATCGFMLPVATGPNALVYGTGKLRVADMIKSGVVFDVVCAVALLLMLWVLCPLYGWT
jgi:solute carrier family 13 (sodium-dependent dicarboxylate transporter), member 2/3/5